jgi:hypothetical protein
MGQPLSESLARRAGELLQKMEHIVDIGAEFGRQAHRPGTHREARFRNLPMFGRSAANSSSSVTPEIYASGDPAHQRSRRFMGAARAATTMR